MPADHVGIAKLLNIFARSLSGDVLVAADRSGMIPVLARSEEGLTAGELSAACSLQPKVTEFVLVVLAHLELVELIDGRFHATEVAARHLDPDLPSYCGAWLNFMYAGREYGHGRLTEYLTNKIPLAGENAYDDEHGAGFLPLMMEAWQPIGDAAAQAFVDQVDLSATRRILDVGAGNGSFAIAALIAQPEATATVVDLPYQIGRLREKIGQAGLSDRVEIVSGSLFSTDLGGGYDAIILNNVLHGWNQERHVEGLRNCLSALCSGGVIYIREDVVDGVGPDFRVEPPLNALGILTTTGNGGASTVADFEQALSAAGFVDFEARSLPDQPDCTHMVTARRP